jgi:lysophospholipase L1-like esterase
MKKNTRVALLIATISWGPAAFAQTGYLALGDSIPFGLNPLLLPPLAPFSLDNFKGYPTSVASSLGLPLVNASRVAETSVSLISGLQSDRLPYPPWSPSYPVFVPYRGSQAVFAVNYLRANPNTRLVTISIGGNDLGVLQLKCGSNTLCILTNMGATLSLVAENLANLLRRIRQASDYDGPIVTLTYYAFNYQDAQTVLAFAALNSVLASVTLAHGGQVADGFGAFLAASAGHRGDACAAGLLVKLPNGTCDTHPSPEGHRVLAQAVLNAAKR